MPQEPTATLSSLLRSSTIQDHDEILKAANAALKANKGDELGQRTRVVALLKLDRFDDALRALDEGGVKLDDRCKLEKIYALYKIGRLEDATKALQSVGLNSRNFCHMAAQVAYRSERFDEARELYSRLLDADAESEDNDISINLRACKAQAQWHQPAAPDDREEPTPDTFELCYNAACAQIAGGAFETAAGLLERALSICEASDDLAEEEKQTEMRPMQAQQAFAYAKMGRVKEAVDICKAVDGKRYV